MDIKEYKKQVGRVEFLIIRLLCVCDGHFLVSHSSEKKSRPIPVFENTLFFFFLFLFPIFILMYTGVSVLVGYLCLLPIISSYTDGPAKSILYYLHALGVSCMIYLLLNDNNTKDAAATDENEIYGLRHLLFNLELPPKTLWFNMGLWDKPGLTFPQACENLVHAVATVMKIQPDSTILGKSYFLLQNENILNTSSLCTDVGFGCGDSCIVLAGM